MIKQILAAGAFTLTILPLSAQAQNMTAWGGVDVSPNAYYSYAGILKGLSGQNVNKQSGVLAHLAAGYGEYHYNTVTVPGGKVNVDLTTAEALVGYGYHFSNGSLSSYVGANIDDHDASVTDPANDVNGSKVGAKVLLDFNIRPTDKISVGAMGSYSTAFEQYWSLINVGHNFGSFTVGPEASFMGNESFNQTRFGIAVSNIAITGPLSLRIYTGFANSSGYGEDGMYGGIGIGASF